MTPRIAPVTQPDQAQAEQLSGVLSSDEGEPLNIFGTLAHHPTLLKRFNVLGGLFMTRSAVPARIREIVILRVAHRLDCAYEWHQHVRIAQQCGLDQQAISTLEHDDAANSGTWAPAERAAIALTDEVLDRDDASDTTWSELQEHFSIPQRLELTMLVGFYRMTAAFLKTVRVQPEP